MVIRAGKSIHIPWCNWMWQEFFGHECWRIKCFSWVNYRHYLKSRFSCQALSAAGMNTICIWEIFALARRWHASVDFISLLSIFFTTAFMPIICSNLQVGQWDPVHQWHGRGHYRWREITQTYIHCQRQSWIQCRIGPQISLYAACSQHKSSTKGDRATGKPPITRNWEWTTDAFCIEVLTSELCSLFPSLPLGKLKKLQLISFSDYVKQLRHSIRKVKVEINNVNKAETQWQTTMGVP